MKINDFKQQTLAMIEDRLAQIKEALQNEDEADMKRFYHGAKNAFNELRSFIEDIPNDKAKPLKLKFGQRYRCLKNLHYSDSDDIMFQAGCVYVVIRWVGRLGIMSNDGIARSNDSGCMIITDEYFEPVND